MRRSLLTALCLLASTTVLIPAAAVSAATPGTWLATGGNEGGLLGVGGNITTDAPHAVTTPASVLSLGYAGDAIAAVDTSGNIWCWSGCSNPPTATPFHPYTGSTTFVQVGGSSNGMFGITTSGALDRLIPGAAPAVEMAGTWSSITSNRFSSNYAIRTDGALFAWGDNGDGQLGVGDSTDRTSPTQVGSSHWSSVVAGRGFTLGIKTDGTLWSWGDDSSGQLGLNDFAAHNAPVQVGTSTWDAITAGDDFTVGIKGDGTLWGWGENSSSQLGTGNTNQHTTPTPLRVGVFSSVSAGGFHTLAVRADGELFSWGTGIYGELGHGNYSSVNVPVRVGTGTGYPFILAGETVSYAVDTGHQLTDFGGNALGDLGDHRTVARSTFGTTSLAGTLAGGTAQDDITLAVHSDHSLWCVGTCSAGASGLPAGIASSPVRLASANTFIAASTDGDTMAAIGAGGAVWTSETGTFTHKTLAGTFVSVASGDDAYFALRNDGALYAWGYNGTGQLGLGSAATTIPTPTRVGTSTWKSVVAVADSTYAIRSDGALYAWGANDVGQLGLGTTAEHTAPVRIGSGLWKTVAAGPGHALGITTAGALYGWGDNAHGDLGLGTFVPHHSPVRIGSALWKAAAASNGFSLAITTGGALYSWGANDIGQLGLGNHTNVNTPHRVGSLATWIAVTAGARESYAEHS